MPGNDSGSRSPLDDRAAEIFERAVALPPNERAVFLEKTCAQDPSLRAELHSLLRAHDAAQSFLRDRDKPGGTDSPAEASTSLAGSSIEDIERYRLQAPLGEGGFGVVYRAEQLQPLRRTVAIKVIKLGMDTRQVIARFEAERQALAMMDHPGIAKVFDAGATRSGRPYFAMELVAGEPITRFCDAHRLNTRQRLELFSQVCGAIQHAHQKGIIHRDIKPSNIIISTEGGVPLPKIIDFGIAKATDAELRARTVFTEHRQLIGTPAYMSPEQAGSTGADIDTRSDIYSLGVLLYELLTGTTPFDSTKLLSSGLEEMLRIIREDEPVRPSTRLSMFGNDKSSVAEHRHTDRRNLRTALKGDLDWIVMRCLEKDRNRRYPTASALAEDIQRHLENQPVVARPPSVAYRLRKFVRRHRASVGAGLAIFFALIGATFISLNFARRAADQRRLAERLAVDAQMAQRLAEKRAEETKQVADFQANMLGALDAEQVGRGIREQFRETLRSALEHESLGEWPNWRKRTPSEIDAELSSFDQLVELIPAADVARRVLDEFLLASATKTIEQSFKAQPLVQAQIHDSLAAAYRALGLYDLADQQSRTALGIRRRELPADSSEIAENLNNVAMILQDRGQYAASEGPSREALAIQLRLHGGNHLAVAGPMQTLAISLRRQQKLEEAEGLYRQSLAIRRQFLGNEHLDVADSLNSLALLLQSKDDYAGAEPFFREALAIRSKLLGERHVIVAGALNNLANLLTMRGERAEAQTLLQRALEIRRQLLGSEHPDVAQSLHNLGLSLNDDGRFAEAEPLFVEAVAIWRKTIPGEHPDLARGLAALAVALKAQKKYSEAEPLFREALDINRRTLGDKDPSIAYSLNGLAALLCDRGDFDQAELHFREIIAAYEERLPPGHRYLGHLGLAVTLVKRVAAGADPPDAVAEHLSEAETLLLAANQASSNSTGAPTPPILVRRCLESLVTLYELRHAAEPEKGFDAKAAEYRTRLQQANLGMSPTTK